MLHRVVLMFLFSLVMLCASSAFADEKKVPRVIRDADTLLAVENEAGSLHASIVHGVDLRTFPIDWDKINVRGAVFCGCRFRNDDREELATHGALIIPAFIDLPYDPFRNQLYSPKELRDTSPGGFDTSLDARIYTQFARFGGTNADVLESMTERLHDDSIEQALRAYIKSRKVVAISGGHDVRRDDDFFKKTAQVAQLLVQNGYFVTTGGGPGMMEAGNLGAYLGNSGPEAIDAAIDILKKAPLPTSTGYYDQANEVVKKFPNGCENMGIPTWFYGNEPSNIFATQIAKYFSDALREDIFLTTAQYGAVFVPGSAGTTQEVFTTATQNNYGSFGYYSPMLFLGKKRYTQDTQMFSTLQQLSKGTTYGTLLIVSDDPSELISFLGKNPPIPVK